MSDPRIERQQSGNPTCNVVQDAAVCSGENGLRTGRRASNWKSSLSIVYLLFLFLGVSVLLQNLAGAYRADLDGYPDEPAHLLTGLMVHDYVMSGFSQRPMQFAESYYLHYRSEEHT